MLSLLLACTATTDTAQELQLEDLASRGALNVGYSAEVLTYTDPLGAERELDLIHWFPTEQDSGAKAEYLGIKRDDVYLDAEPLPDTRTVVFSHGHQGFPEAESTAVDADSEFAGRVVGGQQHLGTHALEPLGQLQQALLFGAGGGEH